MMSRQRFKREGTSAVSHFADGLSTKRADR